MSTAECRDGYMCNPFGGASSAGPGACTPFFDASDAGAS
jgi:hypothetical protein